MSTLLLAIIVAVCAIYALPIVAALVCWEVMQARRAQGAYEERLRPWDWKS